jgi:hypothetical protein
MRYTGFVSVSVLALLLSGCSAVENVASLDIAGNTMAAIGIVSANREKPEDPKPRGPLVVPGQTVLPQPRESATATDPNWPKDSDRAEEVRQAEADRKGQEYLERLSRDNMVLSPQEMAEGFGQMPGDGRNADPIQRGDDGVDPKLSPQELKRQSEDFAKLAEQNSGQNSTERRYLIDPPSDYRRPSGATYEGSDALAQPEPEKKKGLGRLWPF